MRRLLTALLLALGAAGGCHLIGGIEEGTAACRVDGERNGLEVDVDCGGPCAPCADKARCTKDADCVNNACYDPFCEYQQCTNPPGELRCQPAVCYDERHNGAETDVDCGSDSEECVRCSGGMRCLEDWDCATSAWKAEPVCVEGRCVSACCFEDCPTSCCPPGEEDCCQESCGPELLGATCDDETLYCEEPLDCFYESDIDEYGECR